jgi:NADH-quinone oxidoreductase subunit L
MIPGFESNPGRLYVVATLLPLGAFVALLVSGGIRSLCRPHRKAGGFAGTAYWVFGGDKPLKSGAYLATAAIAATAVLAVIGLALVLHESSAGPLSPSRWAERIDWVRIGPPEASSPEEWARQHAADPARPAPTLATALEIGFRIDQLTAVVFAMVSVISTLIFIFSIGYMKDETEEKVEDHEVDVQRVGSHARPLDGHELDRDPHEPDAPAFSPPHPGHFVRRGRFGRFFLYLSLFCFSMLNLVIADNLFQVFVSWELVGVCSFFLIGFYYERPSASLAANKAFIVNRIGDAGFLVGILIAWTYLGTFNFEEMFARVRLPEKTAEGKVEAAELIRVNQVGVIRGTQAPVFETAEPGQYVALMPLTYASLNPKADPGSHLLFSTPHPKTAGASGATRANYRTYGVIPYYLFVVMGVGIFLGCVGKSAQVPLHTWLPDAMEGPTPVSALIHAATMVAAGVYLVGRAYPLFAPEVLLVIAYTGAVTLFIAATIALVQTDIKRILAYSTCSQLGFMMLALGVGGWVAGLLHLITHAFFKALLFLGSGSVIYGCHHEQDVRNMGGLRRKMPITAFTMLVGVLAISGAPLLSGWYSKDQILTAAMEFGVNHREHLALLLLPLIATGFTAYYMFRLWFLTFAGSPRDEAVFKHAQESPAVMTVPLIVLAAFSIGVAWGWPIWVPEDSYLGEVLKTAQPAAVREPSEVLDPVAHRRSVAQLAQIWTGGLPLVLALCGAGVAYWYFVRRPPNRDSLFAAGNTLDRFLYGKWYFDEAYDAAIVNPTLTLAKTAAAVDKQPTDAPAPPGESELPPKRFDFCTLDGVLNATGQLAGLIGRSLRLLQSGRLRTYVLALALTAAVLLAILVAW